MWRLLVGGPPLQDRQPASKASLPSPSRTASKSSLPSPSRTASKASLQSPSRTVSKASTIAPSSRDGSKASTSASSNAAWYGRPADLQCDLDLDPSSMRPKLSEVSEDDWDCGDAEKSVGEVYVPRNRPVSASAANGFASESKDVDSIPHSDLTLLEQIDLGCTAQVFRGCWRGRLVAIKEMHLQWRDLTAFKREMDILCKAKHPNLVLLHGVSFECHPWRIVTELCAGGNLFDLIHVNEIQPSWAQRLKIAIDVAKAMDFLHGFPPPIVHRDLKSLNILLASAVKSCRDPVMAKVSDFGLAKMLTEEMVTMTPAVGTLNWMAPEVMRGGYYDERVDVYSYAMVLFEIVSFELPFEYQEEGCVPRRVLEGARPDMEALPPDTPRWLSSLMVLCWSHVPSERPPFSTILGVLQAPSSLLPTGN